MKRFNKLALSLAICVAACAASLPAAAVDRDTDQAEDAATIDANDTEGQAYVPQRPAKMPDLTKGDPLPPPGKHGYAYWYMGPVGIVALKNGGNGGDQVQVTAVTPGSPADGKVHVGDVLLGVQGKKFHVGGDINREAGNAIIKAEEEAGKGILVLNMWRDKNWVKRTSAKDVFGVDIEKMFKEAEDDAEVYEWKGEEERTEAVTQMSYDKFPIDGMHTNITIQLEVIGTYSDDSPWHCPVVKKVRENAWKYIASKLKPDKRGRRHGSWPDVLAMVASGKPEYVELAKEWVHSLPTTGRNGICQDMNHEVSVYDVTYGGMQSWHHGFNYLEMAIYYDATGDKFILPEVRKRAICAALGQNGGGSWGHTFAFPHFNGGMLHKNNPGYGAMNNAGGRCFFLLALAKKHGINDPEIDAAIERSKRFFGTFVDKGCIPYGYHSPYASDDSNGKNYGPAYAFYTLGMKYDAKYFAMHSAHASFTRRGGHGSPTLWYYTPLSAMMAGPEAHKATMRNMRYFYTLSRRYDGSFIFLGEQPPGIGGKGMRNPTATVAMHLSYPLKQLIITGKDADPKFWMTDEEVEELLISARGTGKRGQIGDPELLEKIGKPWPERSTGELIELLDHFYPNMRRALAKELGKRYQAGEKDIVPQLLVKLADPEARMRDGACKALSACGTEIVLQNLSKVVAMLKDDAEFVRMQAAKTIGGATKPGEEKRELALLNAAADDYTGMTMDNGNLRNAVKGVMFARRGRGYDGPVTLLRTDPFGAGYEEDLVRAAMERIVTMDPQGTVPGGWNREALLKLAGPVTFSAEELQVNDAMFGGARKQEAQALLRKFGYIEAVQGDASNLRKRSLLDRDMRLRVGFKDGNITPKYVKEAPGLYRDYLDDLRLWQWDNPLCVLTEKTGKGKPPILTPINLLIEIIEKDTETRLLPSISGDVAEMFREELAEAGDTDAQIALCRKELDDLYRKNFFRKMHAMTYLAEKLGTKAIDDVSPFLGHEQWRLSKHSNKVACELVGKGAGPRLVELYQEAQARESGLLGNVNAAGILAALADAGYESALPVMKQALLHHDPVVRRAAIQAVFKLGGDAELKTVFAFIRQAKAKEDFDGAEKALLSKKDDAAHVTRVSGAAAKLLPTATPPLRRSLAWVLGQFGGAENLAAIHKAAETTENDEDLKQMIQALAYSPDPAASDHMLELLKIDRRTRDVVASMSVHRLVGRNGINDVSDADKVKFARGIMNYKYDSRLISFLGRVYTGESIRLLFDVMKKKQDVGRYKNSTEIAAKSIIECAEGMRNPTKGDSAIAAEVMTDVIEFIEVAELRGGVEAHMGDKFEAADYQLWNGLQRRAGQALLKFHKPEEEPIDEFDDVDLDI